MLRQDLAFHRIASPVATAVILNALKLLAASTAAAPTGACAMTTMCKLLSPSAQMLFGGHLHFVSLCRYGTTFCAGQPLH